MSRIGNNLNLNDFSTHLLDNEFQASKKQTASQGFEQLAEVLRRQSGLRLVSAEAPIVAPPSPADEAIQKIQEDFENRFAELAADPEKFHSMMKEVYGSNYDHATAEAFRQRALAGDFSWLPKIEFQSDEVLHGGNGAYDADRNVVYINERYLSDTDRASQVYSEEVGHFLDTQLNTSDTVGDEGEMFRHLLHGDKLSAEDEARIRSDNDHGVINVNGKATEVEFSIWDDIGDGVKAVGGAIVDGAEAVGGALVDGAKAVGGGIADAAGWAWDGVQWAANGIGDAAKWTLGAMETAWNWFSERWVDGLRSMTTGIEDAVSGAVRNVLEGADKFFRGVGKIFKGKFGKGLEDMGKGLVKVFVQTPVDFVLMLGGRAISAVQTQVGIEDPSRPLNEEEIKLLREVYGDSIDYSKVRIKEGPELFTIGDNARTHGNVIHLPSNPSKALLIHEMGHVWQHQHGGDDYMTEALWAQAFGDGYNVNGAIANQTPWDQLDREQQAELLKQFYLRGYLPDKPDKVTKSDGSIPQPYVDYILREVQAGRGAA